MPSVSGIRSISVLTLGALVLAGLVGPHAAMTNVRNADEEQARRAIGVVLTAHEDNWNRHDMDAWADAILHEDADWVNWRGAYWHGKAAVKAGHAATHNAHYKSSRLSAQRIEDLTFIARDIVLAHVRSELSGDERAPGQTFPYRKTILFTKQKGVWRIRALHDTRMLDAERP